MKNKGFDDSLTGRRVGTSWFDGRYGSDCSDPGKGKQIY